MRFVRKWYFIQLRSPFMGLHRTLTYLDCMQPGRDRMKKRPGSLLGVPAQSRPDHNKLGSVLVPVSVCPLEDAA